MKHTSFTPEAVAGNTTTAAITDKKGFAQTWVFSVRTVDNLLKAGLPHVKYGQRRIRIVLAEANKWMVEKYGVQRRSNRPTATKEAA